jgi:predicted RNase H-like nuclease (RuvC/YqgF family)
MIDQEYDISRLQEQVATLKRKLDQLEQKLSREKADDYDLRNLENRVARLERA